MTLHIATGGDAAYLPHAAAMMHSAIVGSPGVQMELHYLHGPELPRRDREALTRMADDLGAAITLSEIPDDRIAELPGASFAPRQLWYRVYLPELLPEVDRVLYLDGDTLVLDTLGPLESLDLEGHCLAAVTNVFAPWDAGYPATLGLPAPYFNSGVLLMDLAAWRQRDLAAAVTEHARAHPEALPWGDQDSLNVVLAGDRLALHPRWNCMNSLLAFEGAADVLGEDAVAEAKQRPAIRHFEGPAENKPWHYLAATESRALYREHRLGTPWPEVRYAGRTPRNVLRRAFALRP